MCMCILRDTLICLKETSFDFSSLIIREVTLKFNWRAFPNTSLLDQHTCTSHTTKGTYKFKKTDKNKKRYMTFPSEICSVIFVTVPSKTPNLGRSVKFYLVSKILGIKWLPTPYLFCMSGILLYRYSTKRALYWMHSFQTTQKSQPKVRPNKFHVGFSHSPSKWRRKYFLAAVLLQLCLHSALNFQTSLHLICWHNSQ